MNPLKLSGGSPTSLTASTIVLGAVTLLGVSGVALLGFLVGAWSEAVLLAVFAVFSAWVLWALLDSDAKGKPGLGGRRGLVGLTVGSVLALFQGPSKIGQLPSLTWWQVGCFTVGVLLALWDLETARRRLPDSK